MFLDWLLTHTICLSVALNPKTTFAKLSKDSFDHGVLRNWFWSVITYAIASTYDRCDRSRMNDFSLLVPCMNPRRSERSGFGVAHTCTDTAWAGPIHLWWKRW